MANPAREVEMFVNMRNTTIEPLLDSSVSDLALNVLVAYEDVAAGKRAKGTCDSLVKNLGQDWKVKTHVVSFKMLEVPEWLCSAASDAARADIIVVSCQGNTLPRCVEDWVALWVTRSPRAIALVALFASPPDSFGQQSASLDYLESVGRLSGIPFFSRVAGIRDAAPFQFALRAVEETAL
jgi:hypothetical protein